MTNTALATAMVVIGANVRAELARANRSQSWLGDRLGLKQPAISDRITGKVPFSSIELGQVSALLKVPLDRLYDGAVLEAVS